jgi:hypothetical protein
MRESDLEAFYDELVPESTCTSCASERARSQRLQEALEGLLRYCARVIEEGPDDAVFPPVACMASARAALASLEENTDHG